MGLSGQAPELVHTAYGTCRLQTVHSTHFTRTHTHTYTRTLCAYLQEDQVFTDIVGSAYYVAPGKLAQFVQSFQPAWQVQMCFKLA